MYKNYRTVNICNKEASCIGSAYDFLSPTRKMECLLALTLLTDSQHELLRPIHLFIMCRSWRHTQEGVIILYVI